MKKTYLVYVHCKKIGTEEINISNNVSLRLFYYIRNYGVLSQKIK